jgi:hypothetical protein
MDSNAFEDKRQRFLFLMDLSLLSFKTPKPLWLAIVDNAAMFEIQEKGIANLN